MTKSIENIWKEGFVDDDALIAPKINQLYQQKSQNLVDKMTRTFDYNLKGIAIGSLVIFAALASFGSPLFGGVIAIMLLSSIIIGTQKLNQLKHLEKGDSSYQYLKSFNYWFNNLIEQYTQFYRYLYPAIFLVCMIRFGFSEVGLSIVVGMANDFPSIPLIFGVPIVIPLVVILLASLLSYFAGAIYRLDMYTLYGRQMAKLDEIITDMEAIQH